MDAATTVCSLIPSLVISIPLLLSFLFCICLSKRWLIAYGNVTLHNLLVSEHSFSILMLRNCIMWLMVFKHGTLLVRILKYKVWKLHDFFFGLFNVNYVITDMHVNSNPYCSSCQLICLQCTVNEHHMSMCHGVCDHSSTQEGKDTTYWLDFGPQGHSDKQTSKKKTSLEKKTKPNVSFCYCCRKKRRQSRNSRIRPDWCGSVCFWLVQVKLFDCFLKGKSRYCPKNSKLRFWWTTCFDYSWANMPEFSCCTSYNLWVVV